MDFLRRCQLAALLALTMFGVAYASQNPLSSPTTGVVSGLNLTQNFNNALDSLNTMNSGSTAPANQLSGVPSLGNLWLNTTNNSINVYDGANWNTVAWVDAVNHLVIGQIGGGAASTVASATTANLCGASQASTRGSNVTVSGTTTITSFGSNCFTGQIKALTFSGILTLTYNASSMILPTAANITTATGDTAVAMYLGSGNWQVVAYQRATGAALSSVGLSVGASGLANSALAYTVPVNLGITSSVSSNQLSVNLTGANGSAPSSLNPVLIPFRSATAATGTPTIDSLQGALGITLATTASLGCTTAVACRLWIYAVDNAGTPVVGLMNCSTGSQLYGCNDDLLYATASGTTGGTSPGTLYGSTGSLSGKAVRIVGYLEATWTSGTGWASATKIQLFGPGIAKPGAVLQTVYATNAGGSTASGSPQTLANASVTPSSAVNLVIAQGGGSFQNFGVSNVAIGVGLYRGTTLQGSIQSINAGTTNTTVLAGLAFLTLDSPAATTAQTYAIKYFSGNAVNTVNAAFNFIMVQEIMGALDAPANDNGDALRLVG